MRRTNTESFKLASFSSFSREQPFLDRSEIYSCLKLQGEKEEKLREKQARLSFSLSQTVEASSLLSIRLVQLVKKTFDFSSERLIEIVTAEIVFGRK